METAIRAEGLSKRFGRQVALAPLDLEVARGEVLGYLGPNGAGKTVTIRLLPGLLHPTAGRAEIFGCDVRRCAAQVHRRLAYVGGETNLWPALTGAETLHLLGRVQGRVDTAYRDKLIERFRLDPSKRVRSYSKGNRQKVALIAALMSRADRLVLDEPSSGLDPLMEREFRDCVAAAKANGQTVFLSSHILSEVEALADRVAILRAGHLVEVGSLAEMRHLAALTIDAVFTAEPPYLTRVPGVTGVEVDGNRVRLQVRGSVEPLLARLTAARVTQLLSREPSLEELFLERYGAEQADRPEEAVPHGR
ncbi:ABC transporter ATP-binding protein [Nocardia seriolae]|uniref:Phosphonates import ATP-binding protein PhnC n=1 Tax=Nocardia seriolae TaxID=37332 RepID=A0ABC8AWC3_9NOCA|nr:ABC transporter ATP-binding protein [Nocardia seriolae]APA98443.1 Phosphonates import ATP-binding protein PhnC [Nocardia seriolae]OJF80327.1 ABC transporter ATP-binding protein [Nocardia seriolae]PSK29142.1 ABC transporter ATP-binding protein [Nocardia seriolae]QOW35725.1 ABC transporter ATP-binding protein [Nocardia seriolae]QUN16784.1 ABC transporter ATP-binding protein [Nocardia seriolae]